MAGARRMAAGASDHFREPGVQQLHPGGLGPRAPSRFRSRGKLRSARGPRRRLRYWLRLSRIGDFAFVDDVVMEYRRHAMPTWVRPRAGVSYVRRKILSAPENTPEQAALARRGYRLCARWTAAHELREAARLARARRLGVAAKMLVRAALNATAYVRGAPVWAYPRRGIEGRPQRPLLRTVKRVNARY